MGNVTSNFSKLNRGIRGGHESLLDQKPLEEWQSVAAIRSNAHYVVKGGEGKKEAGGAPKIVDCERELRCHCIWHSEGEYRRGGGRVLNTVGERKAPPGDSHY